MEPTAGRHAGGSNAESGDHQPLEDGKRFPHFVLDLPLCSRFVLGGLRGMVVGQFVVARAEHRPLAVQGRPSRPLHAVTCSQAARAMQRSSGCTVAVWPSVPQGHARTHRLGRACGHRPGGQYYLPQEPTRGGQCHRESQIGLALQLTTRRLDFASLDP